MKIPKQISERTKVFAAVVFIVAAYAITDFLDSQISQSTSGLTMYEVKK